VGVADGERGGRQREGRGRRHQQRQERQGHHATTDAGHRGEDATEDADADQEFHAAYDAVGGPTCLVE